MIRIHEKLSNSYAHGQSQIDFLKQMRLSLDQVDIRIQLSPNKPKYFRMSVEADTYSMKMISARLELVKVASHLSVLTNHRIPLYSLNAKYPMCLIEIKTFTIAQIDMHVVKENIYMRGRCPAGSSSVS